MPYLFGTAGTISRVPPALMASAPPTINYGKFRSVKELALWNHGHQVFCVDGKIKGWSPTPGDYLWDHHAPGGEPTQVEDLLPLWTSHTGSILSELSDGRPAMVCTGGPLDMDAIASAVLLRGGKAIAPYIDKLIALGRFSDELVVPAPYSHLSEFAIRTTYALLQWMPWFEKPTQVFSQLPTIVPPGYVRKMPSRFIYEMAVQWLLDSMLGNKPWPHLYVPFPDTQELIDRLLPHIQVVRGIPVINDFQSSGSMPFAPIYDWYRAAHALAPDSSIVLWVHARSDGKTVFSIGVNPFSANFAATDLTGLGARLSAADYDPWTVFPKRLFTGTGRSGFSARQLIKVLVE